MKYSVIIPVYNAEKTLRRCVDSLLEQSYSDAEIILVNDGSRDRSEEICREYAEAHPNISLITQQNRGVSSARNAGLDAARGEYIVFVDSDDHVVPEFFSFMDKATSEDSADLIRFAGYFDNGMEKKKLSSKPLRAHSREELMPYIVDAICQKTINGPWAKLYRRELIDKNHIRFPVGTSVGEDMAFNTVYSFYIDSFVQSDDIVYIVNTENGESLSRRRHNDLQGQFKTVSKYLDHELAAAPISDKEKQDYRRAIDYVNCVGIYYEAKLMILDHERWFKRQKRLVKLCRIINEKHLKYPKTRYCILTTLPIRLYLTPIIDAMALVLSRRK